MPTEIWLEVLTWRRRGLVRYELYCLLVRDDDDGDGDDCIVKFCNIWATKYH